MVTVTPGAPINRLAVDGPAVVPPPDVNDAEFVTADAEAAPAVKFTVTVELWPGVSVPKFHVRVKVGATFVPPPEAGVALT